MDRNQQYSIFTGCDDVAAATFSTNVATGVRDDKQGMCRVFASRSHVQYAVS